MSVERKRGTGWIVVSGILLVLAGARALPTGVDSHRRAYRVGPRTDGGHHHLAPRPSVRGWDGRCSPPPPGGPAPVLAVRAKEATGS